MTRVQLKRHANEILQAALMAATVMSLPCSSLRAQTAPTPPRAAAPATDTKAKRQAEKLYVAGARAVQHNDMAAAHTAFAKAAELDPQNPDYTAAEQLARANLVTQLIQETDKARMLHQDEAARAKLLEAQQLAPDNPSVLQHLDPSGGAAVIHSDEQERAVDLAPVVELTPDTARHTFHIHGTGEQLLKQVLEAYGITPSVDPSIETKRTNFDGDDLTYLEAAQLLQLETNSFFVALDPKRVLIAKDSRENRERFQRQAVETVYVPGLPQADLTDMGNMARMIFDAQQATVQQQSNTLTIRAPEERLTALNETMAKLLMGRSQVDLEVRLIELDSSRTTNVGVTPPQQFSAFNVTSELNSIINANQSLVQQIIANGLASANDLAAIVAVLIASGEVSSSLLGSGFATFGGGLTLTGVTLPSVSLNLALNSSKTRMLEDVHLLLQDQAEGNLQVGEKYPIETSSYSGITSSQVNIPGVSSAGLSSELAALGLGGAAGTQTPIPQVQYQDIGLQLKVTPRVLRSHDIGLNLTLKLQALAGASVNNIPELTNREFTATTTAKAGETAVFVSDLNRQETVAVSGIPGLSQIPGFGDTTDDDKSRSTSRLLIIITPRMVRGDHTKLAGPVIPLPRHD